MQKKMALTVEASVVDLNGTYFIRKSKIVIKGPEAKNRFACIGTGKAKTLVFVIA